MSFAAYLFHGAFQYLLKGVLLITTLFYILVLAGIILQSPLGNKVYTTPILWQAGLWCACVSCIALYQRYCSRAEREPSGSVLKLMHFTLLGLTLLGFVLAELYAGLLQNTLSDLIRFFV